MILKLHFRRWTTHTKALETLDKRSSCPERHQTLSDFETSWLHSRECWFVTHKKVAEVSAGCRTCK
jgi:hypothetical protein